MAAMGTSSAFMQKGPQDLTKILVTAIFEWLLISLLFVDAIFSYIITKFAYYCGLQTPCLLCSRLDHVLGKEKLGYYWDLFCGNHKSEISSLVLCYAHHKLVDVHGMCESCLFSFATINRSNAETYRLLVGKLGDDANFDFDQDPLLGGHKPCLSSGTLCSCCKQPCISRGHSQKLIQTKKFGSEAELDVPLSRDIEHNQKELRKGQDESYISVRATHMRDSGLHPLSHVGYTELKVTSDTESEVHFSDDDNASGLIHERCDPKEDISAQYAESRIITPALIDPASVPKPSLLTQVDPNSNGSTSVASTVAFGHGLEELNWQKVGSKADFPALTEPILDNTPPSSNAMEAPVEVSKGKKDVTITHETDQISAAEPRELYKGGVRALTTSETGVETIPISSNIDQQVTNVLDLGDAYKLVVVSKGSQLSGVLAEQWIGKDSSRVTEDLKVLLSQLSGTRGNEQSTNEMSPKLSPNSGDLKASDSSNSIGLQILQKRISLERNESGLSLDGSIVSEIEGESVVDRLKRQVEHDKKLMSALYKELEEERNASAVASDQAMAMITRLQEEKAAIHMEALQHLRMMEEQAEYDNEALQKIDDLLVEKEKEIQDLEAELEFYRRKFPNESMLENLPETTCDIQARDIVVDHSESSSIEHSASVPKHVDTGRPHTYSTMPFSDEDGGRVKTSLLDFEDEKIEILQCLEKLEKALSLFSNNGENSDSSKGDCSENGGNGVGKSNLHNGDGGSQQNDAIRENGLPMQHQVPVTSGHISSLENPLLNGKQSETYCNGQNSAELCQVTDLASLPILISDLNKRLKALEADRGFLERTINSLRYGEEGLKFIEQIASHLGELRKVGIRRDQTSA
ncbi:PREDICTED: myosin-binding [Prunus dulcis]|uniref:PREDICTED: myosin-binding n=1 Tax=Prunus dulcis TaxID=3755 RepID=A0A5E4EEG6_PRUDU|nr:myosin-binding protein 1 isoform X1 [Prunus dulcis]VVA12941.1 PREDICTED: myosin-binding [Prunus dulcis]